MTEEELKARTRAFAIEAIEVVRKLQRNTVAAHCGRQLLRCGTSVGANYRAACRGRSDAEMAAKLGIVVEEADEVLFWTDILVKTGELKQPDVAHLEAEADQILRIVVASTKTLRKRIAGGSSVVREAPPGYDLGFDHLEYGLAGNGQQSTSNNQQ